MGFCFCLLSDTHEKRRTRQAAVGAAIAERRAKERRIEAKRRSKWTRIREAFAQARVRP